MHDGGHRFCVRQQRRMFERLLRRRRLLRIGMHWNVLHLQCDRFGRNVFSRCARPKRWEFYADLRRHLRRTRHVPIQQWHGMQLRQPMLESRVRRRIVCQRRCADGSIPMGHHSVTYLEQHDRHRLAHAARQWWNLGQRHQDGHHRPQWLATRCRPLANATVGVYVRRFGKPHGRQRYRGERCGQ